MKRILRESNARQRVEISLIICMTNSLKLSSLLPLIIEQFQPIQFDVSKCANAIVHVNREFDSFSSWHLHGLGFDRKKKTKQRSDTETITFNKLCIWCFLTHWHIFIFISIVSPANVWTTRINWHCLGSAIQTFMVIFTVVHLVSKTTHSCCCERMFQVNPCAHFCDELAAISTVNLAFEMVLTHNGGVARIWMNQTTHTGNLRLTFVWVHTIMFQVALLS